MKEITKHRNERFPSVILFREDLDTIHKIISETSKASSGVKISSGDYEYDSLDELGGNVGKQISDLIISTLYPSIVLSFSRRGGTRLFTMDIDAAETAFLKIVEV